MGLGDEDAADDRFFACGIAVDVDATWRRGWHVSRPFPPVCAPGPVQYASGGARKLAYVPGGFRGGREWALTGQFRGRIELQLGLSASKETPLMGQLRGALLNPHTTKAPGSGNFLPMILSDWSPARQALGHAFSA